MKTAAIGLGLVLALVPAAAGAPRESAAELPARTLSKLVRALITDPDSPSLHYDLGQVYLRQGIFPQAEKEFQTAIQLSKLPGAANISPVEFGKAYLKAVRSQRSLESEMKQLTDLRRLAPRDEEIARWIIELHLDKGDEAAARAIMNSFPQLKQHPDILAKWVRASGAGSREDMARQEERFKDLETLFGMGSSSHRTGAAHQILELAARLPPAAVTPRHHRVVETAFRHLLTAPEARDTAAQLIIYRQYLDLIDHWKLDGKSRLLVQGMRKKFPAEFLVKKVPPKEPVGTAQAIEILSNFEQKSKEGCRKMARLYADRNQWEMAAGWMEKGVETSEDKAQTAWYWFRAGQFDEASQLAPKGGLFEAVLDAEAGRISTLKKKNPKLLRILLGELPAAPSSNEKILDRWTQDELLAVRQRSERGDHEAVLAMCDSILNRTASGEAFYLKGVTQLTLGFYEEAGESLEKAARTPDWSIPANLKLGQMALMRGRWNEALGFLEHAGPGSDPSELVLAWGMALALTKSPEQGEQILTHISAKSARGKFFLGRLLEQQGRSKEALQMYRSLVKNHEDFIPGQYRFGRLAKAAGDTADAERAFSAIVQRQPPADPFHQAAAEELEKLKSARNEK